MAASDSKVKTVPKAWGDLPTEGQTNDEVVDITAYEREVPRWRRIYQHSLTQMIMLAIQSFCGPAMSDAISGLGGGGLATPKTSNISTAIFYAALALVCFFGGPIVNKMGIKWALALGAATFPIRGSSYYCNSKFGNQWYLILGGFLSGAGSGLWYVAEAGSIMSLAPSHARGKYLALWIVSRNLGQLVGGAINLAKNVDGTGSGGITPDTYIAFVVIECLALPFAFFISPLKDVVRSDGTRIRTMPQLSSRKELKLIKTTLFSKLILLISLWSIWSFFYSGSWSTYLGIYFSVRVRSLSSLISPFFCIVGCFGLGLILDIKRLSQRRRAQLGLFTVIILNLGVYVWSIIMQVRFDANPPGAIDWSDKLFASAFLPYFFVQTTGPLSQSYAFWLLSCFATDAQANVRNGATFRCIEAVGQAISFAVSTQTQNTPLTGFCITFGLMGLCLPPALLLVNSAPDEVPADVLIKTDGHDQSKAQEAKVAA